MRRLRFLMGRHRAPSVDRTFGLLLAFNAGAVNAGGFLVLHMYTSHMTGFASQLADGLVLGNTVLVLNALGALLAFICGAATSAMQVNWGRQYRLRSVYALPLMLEAVLLLSFIMGLQNAMCTKSSGGKIRTTHMTGNVTDLGIELGKMLYWNRRGTPVAALVRHNRQRLQLFAGLIGMFIAGGLMGAAGFKYVGFICVVPLAALLLLLSLPPFLDDVRRSAELRQVLRALAVRLRLRKPDEAPAPPPASHQESSTRDTHANRPGP